MKWLVKSIVVTQFFFGLCPFLWSRQTVAGNPAALRENMRPFESVAMFLRIVKGNI